MTTSNDADVNCNIQAIGCYVYQGNSVYGTIIL